MTVAPVAPVGLVAGSGSMSRPKPAYAVGAVDHALMTLDVLSRRPVVRLTDLAVELGIGRATAHRLLQMMVFRGYAVQNGDRSYSAGPALSRPRRPDDAQELRQLRLRMLPHLEEASRTLQETVHLKVLIGIEAVCLDSVEGSRPLHTPGVRESRFPAERVSGGLALLATLPADELLRRYAGRPDASMTGLQRQLATTRNRGFGLIVGEGSAGITSVATIVTDIDRRAVAALSCSAPTMRMSRAQIVHSVDMLRAVADVALAAMWPSVGTSRASGRF